MALTLRTALGRIGANADPCAELRTKVSKIKASLDVAEHGETFEDAQGHPHELKPDPNNAKKLKTDIAQAQAALDKCVNANPKKLPLVHVAADFSWSPKSVKAMMASTDA